MNAEIIAVGKTADSLAVEVQTIIQVAQRQIHQVVASAAMDIGDRLTEAKKLVPHGEWEAYVKERCGLSPRTAQTYMQMAANREKAQTFADLPFSKALALLALPEGQVEAFAAEHNPEELSTRQLREQIKAYQGKLDTVGRENGQLRADLQQALDNNSILGERCSQAEINAQNLRYDLEQAKNKPAEISEEDASKLRAEGYSKGVNEGATKMAKLERQLAEQAEAHEKALANLADETRDAFADKNAEIADLTARLNAATQTPADLRGLVASSVQDAATAAGDSINRMHGWYLKVKASDPQLAGAIRQMVEAMISQMYSKFDIDPI